MIADSTSADGVTASTGTSLPNTHARMAGDVRHSVDIEPEVAGMSFEMAAWRSFPLLVLGALISVECTQYSPSSVVCSGSCCPECLNDLQDSCDERECFFSHGAEYVIDNNLQTLWNSSAQYSNTMPISVGLTMDLDQV